METTLDQKRRSIAWTPEGKREEPTPMRVEWQERKSGTIANIDNPILLACLVGVPEKWVLVQTIWFWPDYFFSHKSQNILTVAGP
jgi:hypothetical protein